MSGMPMTRGSDGVGYHGLESPTFLELTIVGDRVAQISGIAAASRLQDLPRILDSIRLDAVYVQETPRAPWRQPKRTLHIKDGTSRDSRLVTQWRADVGPIQELSPGPPALVRASDGTIGWTSQDLGEACPEPLVPCPRWEKRLADRALGWRGTKYLLGGTTRRGIDCSGLVQRLYWELFGILLPRHSRDQMESFLPGRTAASARSGDVVFLPSVDRAHVGLIVETRRGMRVLHASEARGVVADSLERFTCQSKTVVLGRFETAFLRALAVRGLPQCAAWDSMRSRCLRAALEPGTKADVAAAR